MTLSIKNNIIFDLDDTLYNEVCFLKSAYKEIATVLSKELNLDKSLILNDMLEYFKNKINVFETVINKYSTSFTVNDLLHFYRNHEPNIELAKNKIEVLDYFKNKGANLGLLTDGRSLQQRNKIKALKLEKWFSEIVISEEFGSEKPNINNYKHFEEIFGVGSYYYIGDNINKDFVCPNKLGWTTVCLKDSGLNIHKQDFSIDKKYLAKYVVDDFSKLSNLI